ncbi:hypothetical protein MUP05_10480 [Candidatus Bathyarchaeota archaeon]|nr:hypothetical protein [Candidatus Bathyarchaeota archaeon]
MSFTRFLATHVSSPTEKIMHSVHEAVGWSVLVTVGAVLVLGGGRTYLLHRKTEVELAAAINRSSILKAMVDAHRNYFSPAYRTLFVSGAVGLCAGIYRMFEVGVVDKFNYVTASAVRRFSDLLYEYVDVAVVDGLNYFVANMTKKLSDLAFKYGELAGIDKLNYVMADSAIGLSSRFRKTHLGVLSYNMTLVGLTLVISLILLLYAGRHLG